VVGQHGSFSIFRDAFADKWSVSSAAVPSDQSPAFHFISQLLNQIDVGFKMAATDVCSVTAQFPIHGMFYFAPLRTDVKFFKSIVTFQIYPSLLVIAESPIKHLVTFVARFLPFCHPSNGVIKSNQTIL